MSIGVVLTLELMALGVVSGFLAGLLGIGGGMIMVPFITMILGAQGIEPGMAVKMAIATSMSTIMFTSLSSLRAHHRLNAVRWDLVAALAPGLVIGGLISGAGIFAMVKGRGLAIFFAAFIGYSALQMFLDRKPSPSRQLPRWPGLTAVGCGIGALSGLVGAGGGFMSVPFMVWCNVQIQTAIGTSAALGFPIALANTAGYVIAGRDMPAVVPGAFGYLYLPALLLISIISVLLAPIGARTAHRLDARRLKRVMGVCLFLLAAYMLNRGLA